MFSTSAAIDVLANDIKVAVAVLSFATDVVSNGQVHASVAAICGLKRI
jgi:hypothetical protein